MLQFFNITFYLDIRNLVVVVAVPKSRSQADKVYLSDLNKNTIDNLTYNIELNNTALLRHKKIKNSRVEAIALDWDDEGTWPMGKIDYIIGSDLIYQRSVVPLLKKVVAGLLPQRSATAEEDNGFFLYVAPDNGRNGLSEFVTEMKLTGFDCVYERMAPDEFRQNPLMSGDEEDCFLHFHELAVKNYVMYEFQRTR